MTEQKRERFSPPAVGGSSLLTVFAVLALTVFALLSLSTVRADVRLADASAQAIKDYYAADCQAQEILARLRNGEAVESAEVEQAKVDYIDRPADLVRFCSYAVPISETQELQVEVVLESGGYRVLRWQAVPVGDWEPDDGLNLWDGE